MRLVLDCNVLVSAGLGSMTCRRVVERSIERHVVLVSAPILTECFEVIARPKFSRVRDESDRLASALAGVAEYVTPGPAPFRVGDPDDQPYLDTAFSDGAHRLCTGNHKGFAAPAFGTVLLYSPRAMTKLSEF